MNRLMVQSHSCEHESCKCCFELERQTITSTALCTNKTIPEKSNKEEKHIIIQCKDEETKEKWITTISNEISRIADFYSF